MISKLMYKPHITCLSTDIVIQNGKTLTTDTLVNKSLTNGSEVYCIDTSECYLYDEENKTLIPAKVNSDILIDGEITPESVNIINTKVDNFINDVNERIAQADIDKVIELNEQVNIIGNPNLLINSDFRNPINQRGQTTYTSGTAIDKWTIKQSKENTTTLTVDDEFVTLSGVATGNCYIIQEFEPEVINRLDGKDISISIRYRNNSNSTFRVSFTNIIDSETNLVLYLTPSDRWTELKVTGKFELDDDTKSSGIIIQNYNGTSFVEGSVDVQWLKMELGDKVTPIISRPYIQELQDCLMYSKQQVSTPYSNPNLIINGDFRNPINQRGQTTYEFATSNKQNYSIDRWRLESGKISVENGYIRLDGSSNIVIFTQMIEASKQLINKEVTFTVKYRAISGTEGNSLTTRLGTNSTVKFKQTPLIYDSQWREASYTFVLTEAEINNYIQPSIRIAQGVIVDIEYAKLELGRVSTPFTPRHYAEELALCQRYYISGEIGGTGIIYLADAVYFLIPLPNALRVVPTLVGGDNVKIYNSANSLQGGFTSACSNITKNTLTIRSEKISNGLSNAYINISSNSGLDSEIY